tara:strand:+ start:631 stop:882 length:252 start_codon:yes stop_codon:yes gene_type:complete
MSEVESTTIIGRDEKIGKKYPLFVERILLFSGIIFYIFSFSKMIQEFNTEWVGILVTLTIYPFLILFTIEMIGRIFQRIHSLN